MVKTKERKMTTSVHRVKEMILRGRTCNKKTIYNDMKINKIKQNRTNNEPISLRASSALRRLREKLQSRLLLQCLQKICFTLNLQQADSLQTSTQD